ncbi:TonB-dependent receptor domain-containing protein [Woodsholea maritima]|uniref:TonB-dependent receptor domain-containing protein n=1 Tax=Woodsholea maritima TaxID=240237 RepID=UPI0003A8012F|nr:TonB-dependent receptor [Woodsholea maritima]
MTLTKMTAARGCWQTCTLIGLSAFMLTTTGWAQDTPLIQDNAEEHDEPTDVETIIVTGTATGLNLRDAPASVSVITREDIEVQPVHNLADILGRIPGVTGGLSPSGEQSKIRIRGLPENYTLILVNGRRIGNSRDVNYRPDLGRQDLDWIAPDMIERIEVVRGPMSSLYGSDAMGGVINIITRPITQIWSGSASANYTWSQEDNRGDAYQLNITASGPLIKDRLGVRLGASYSRQNPDERDIGGRGQALGTGGVTDKSLNSAFTLSLTPQHTVSLEGTYGLQESLAPPVPNDNGQDQYGWGPSHLERTSFRLGHEGEWGALTSQFDISHNRYVNDVGEGDTSENKDTIIDAIVRAEPHFGVQHKFAFGGQFRSETLQNTQTIGRNPVDYDGDLIEGAQLEGDTWALFTEDQMALRDNLLLTLGLRMDSHDKYGEHFSPRAYIVYHFTPAWTLRGGVSQGFRAPTLKENSPAAATFSRGGGCGSLAALGYSGGGCWMAGNPKLDPEESTNYEIGLAWEKNDWTFGTTYFHTDFKNKIEYAPLGFYEGLWWTRMENVNKARTRGLEANLTVPLHEAVTWQTNATWMIEAKDTVTDRPLITTPEVSAYTTVDWRVSSAFSMRAGARYTGEQLGAGNAITKAYTIVDLTSAYRINDDVTLRFGIENVLAEEINSDSGYNYYQPGRQFFFAINTRY